MYCKHAHTLVIICGKGNRLKIHRWGNKRKITVTVYQDDKKTDTYLIGTEYAEKFWNFTQQIYKNFIYSKEEYFKHIPNRSNVMVNLYKQLFDDLLALVIEYATNKNHKHKSSGKVPTK